MFRAYSRGWGETLSGAPQWAWERPRLRSGVDVLFCDKRRKNQEPDTLGEILRSRGTLKGFYWFALVLAKKETVMRWRKCRGRELGSSESIHQNVVSTLNSTPLSPCVMNKDYVLLIFKSRSACHDNWHIAGIKKSLLTLRWVEYYTIILSLYYLCYIRITPYNM